MNKKIFFLTITLISFVNANIISIETYKEKYNVLAIDNKKIEEALNKTEKQKFGFDCQWVSLSYLSNIIDDLKINNEKPLSLNIDVTGFADNLVQKFFGPLASLKINENDKNFIKVGALPSLVKDYIYKLNPQVNVVLHETNEFNEEDFINNIILSLSNQKPVYVYTGSSDGFTTHGSLLIGYRLDDDNKEYFAFLETNKTIIEIKKEDLIKQINIKNAIKAISALHSNNYEIVTNFFAQKQDFFLVSKEDMNNWKNVSYITFND